MMITICPERLAITWAIMLTMVSAFGQTDSNNMTGEYYLEGVMETASGFLLQPDSTFKFFYSYGALDRYGEGRWTAKDGTIELISRPRPEKDFRLIGASKSSDDFMSVRIVDQNQMLLRYVDCALGNAKTSEKTKSTNDEGLVTFPKRDFSIIALLFRLCPDRPSVFKIEDPALNKFEFAFEPWISEVFFDKFKLQADGNGLEGKHPLLMGDKYHYVKQ